MRIAFYAPMKPLDHPVPSGEQRMGRLLYAALQRAGHEPFVASRLRTYNAAGDPALEQALQGQALAEADRLVAGWRRDGRPDLWFTYHPYYKSPDWTGPRVAARLGIPYATAEASLARKQLAGRWRRGEQQVAAAAEGGAVHFCFTANDRDGLAAHLGPSARLVELAPFIDVEAWNPRSAASAAPAGPGFPADVPVFLTVAMMRPGVKLASYRRLAEALGGMQHRPWRLAVAGDGPARAEVTAAFAAIDAERIVWRGELEAAAIAGEACAADLFLWPGIGEAYGLVYLEAQAMGLPAIAFDTAGVPSVVRHGSTGLLVPLDDVSAYRAAILRLLDDPPLRRRMGEAAMRFVGTERTLAHAAAVLDRGLAHARAEAASP